ncbi:MAG: PAS domain S-box protein [Ignavibacteria bacterium]|jgi:PAS domain S-box-containing protein
MNANKSYLSRKSDIFLFAVIITIIIIIAGYEYYKYEENIILSEKYNELKGIAALKTSNLSDWYQDEVQDAEFISDNPELSDLITNWISNRSSSIGADILNRFIAISHEHGYENILLAGKDGELLYSLNSKVTSIDSVVSNRVKDVLSKEKVLATGLFKSKMDKKVGICFIAPIKDKQNNITAVVIFEIDPYDFLYPFIQRWPTVSKSAETIIVRKQGNKVLFLNELRHIKNTALKLSFNLSQKNIPAVMAVLGSENIFEGIDYRGVEVLSDIRPVPGTPWFMITKIDEDEIFSELDFRIGVVIIFIVMLISLLILTLIWVYNRRQIRIRGELYVKEKELRESHEEFKTALYSIGDGVIITDKRGNIKQMNPEAERLTGWKEREAIGRSLEEVFNIITETTRNKVENPVKRVLLEGVVVGRANHTLLISKGGKETPIADSGAPIKNENGKIIGVVLVFQDQTNERNIRNALIESKKRLLEAQQIANIGNWHYDIKKKELYWSDQLYKIYENDPYVSDNLLEVILNSIHPDDKKRVEEYYNNSLVKHSPAVITHRLTMKDGRIKFVEQRWETFFENNEKPVRILGTVQDITAMKEAEIELLTTQFSVDYASVAIFWITEDAGFDYVNELACTSLGYTRDELLKLKLWDIDPAYSIEAWGKSWESYTNRETEGVHIDTLHKRKDGTYFPVEVSSKHLFFENKEFHVCFVRDITKRKEAESALKESEERLRLALQATKQGIYDWDLRTDEVKVNPDYAYMLGYDPDEFTLTKQKWIDMLYQEDKNNTLKILSDYLEGRIKEYYVEFRLLTKAGNWKWILSIGEIVEKDEKGNPLRMLGTHTDITYRKKIEHDLIEAKERAESSEKLKSEFLAQMSHEIRSPIHIILSYVDIIKEMLDDHIRDEDLIESFESITLAGNRIIRTIDLILNMSDLQLGAFECNYKKVDLNHLLESLVREYIRPANNKNVKINFANQADSNIIVTDEYALGQIFANLIDNAVKYTHSGEINVELSNNGSDKFIVRVSDTGIGISPEYIPVLFAPFSQEEQGYTRKFDGNGLGLSLVKNYSDLLGAEIDVESKKNEGTTFTVTLVNNISHQKMSSRSLTS